MDQFNAVSQAPSADMYSILMQRPDETAASETYRVPIGTQSDGTMLSADLEQITHMLVCGYTGTGKTSFVQTAALYLARNHSPKHIHFILFDSKMVDYAAFRDLPHLSKPIINDDAKADETISWLEKESDRRLALIHGIGAKDIVSYNQQCSLHRQEPLPRFLLIMDDFASLQMYKKYNTPMTLISVLQNGRIAGIHVVLVTSVTSSKILPKNLLSLIPCRISFCVSERADSRLAVDKEGAETLRVPGELMIRYQSALQKCEGAYLPETQMPSVIKRIQRDNLLQVSTLGNMTEQLFRDVAISQPNAPSSLSANDQLLRLAMDCFVDAGLVSTTAMQRRLRIGYAKAGRIIDELEELGLIGPSQGASPRKVLLSREQWEQVRNQEGSLASALSTLDSAGNNHIDDTTAQGKPDTVLRSYPQIAIETHNLSIANNEIIIYKKIRIDGMPAHTTVRIPGKSVDVLFYKKPGIFTKKGYIRFQIKQGTNITNQNPELLTIGSDTLSDLLTINFEKKDAKQIKAFMCQISEDTGVPLTEL